MKLEGMLNELRGRCVTCRDPAGALALVDQIEEQTEGLDMRPEVLAFARLMEVRLRRHDATRGPRGWRSATAPDLRPFIELSRRKLIALLDEIDHGTHVVRPEELAGQCADDANHLMMMADACRLEV